MRSRTGIVAVALASVAGGCGDRLAPDTRPPVPTFCGNSAAEQLNPSVPPYDFRVQAGINSSDTLHDALIRVRAELSYTGDSDRNGDEITTICVDPGTYPGGVVIDLNDFDHPLFIYGAAGSSFTSISGVQPHEVAHHAIAIRGIRTGFLGESAPAAAGPGEEPVFRPARPEVTLRGLDISGWDRFNASDGLEQDDHGGGAIFADYAFVRLEEDVFGANGRHPRGGAVAADSATLEIHLTELRGNNSVAGGAVAVHQTDLSVTDCQLTDNTASGYGGAIFVEGFDTAVAQRPVELRVSGSTFENNEASNEGSFYSAGGALLISREVDAEIEDSSFVGNAALSPQSTSQGLGTTGGAIQIGQQITGSVHITRVAFEENRARDAGGAIWASAGTVPVVIEESSFVGNETLVPVIGGGGAISTGRPFSISSTHFEGNAAWFGGAIASGADLVVDADSTFDLNHAETHGGGIRAFGSASVQLTDAVFTNNNAGTGDGGAIRSTGDDLIVENVEFIENTAADEGGAVSFVFGPTTPLDLLSLSNVTFEGNAAGSDGGGLRVSCGNVVTLSGIALLQNTDFVDNESGGRGGGVFSLNCILSRLGGTYSGNSAVLEGGAIYSGDPAPGTAGPSSLFQVDLRGNSAPLGGAIYSSRNHLRLANVLVVENEASHGSIYLHGPSANDVPPLDLSFVTVAGNQGLLRGGIVCSEPASILADCFGPTINNSVIAFNEHTATFPSLVLGQVSGTALGSNNIVYGGSPLPSGAPGWQSNHGFVADGNNSYPYTDDWPFDTSVYAVGTYDYHPDAALCAAGPCSPLVNAADPAQGLDADGSLPDIGAYGGPDGVW